MKAPNLFSQEKSSETNSEPAIINLEEDYRILLDDGVDK